MTLLQATNLSHAFDYPLFHDINLTIAAKESVAIVGVSGSGKSTLLHILATLLAPNKGRVELFGTDIYAKKNQKKLIEIRREKIGIVFQSHYLFKGFSAIENIEVAALLSKQEIDNELIEAFGIERVIHKRVTQLSGGEQQRVSIARVLTKKPKLLFADEPTGNLDRKTAYEVMDGVFDYVNSYEAGLFLVTHDMELAKRCDRIFRLQEQRLEPL
ncbi:ABC transporter ATP-binding protein [Nitratiruptor sp. YY09-18]|uniref:ABC transporter ATP-binding protein n=1 Tax=Nitratiruptor sp. YY09-18 TaxID=2724901 RepID=UPI0019168667|nr:ABC transporter ATP-binding protein [Nitratiruptor sp. YY09-18]BCD68639.1 putative ABC transport system ATP-binding protein [Nitratiruptor sp. YY09-18]